MKSLVGGGCRLVSPCSVKTVVCADSALLYIAGLLWCRHYFMISYYSIVFFAVARNELSYQYIDNGLTKRKNCVFLLYALGFFFFASVFLLLQSSKLYFPTVRSGFVCVLLVFVCVCFFWRGANRPPRVMKTWDQDGEFNSKQEEHVPVSRLIDMLNTQGQAACSVPPEEAVLLQHIYALQVQCNSIQSLFLLLQMHRP